MGGRHLFAGTVSYCYSKIYYASLLSVLNKTVLSTGFESDIHNVISVLRKSSQAHFFFGDLVENAVLYQNYKEKALDIDSDEEVDLKEQKTDEKIVIQYKPLRSTWSQLSVVSVTMLNWNAVVHGKRLLSANVLFNWRFYSLSFAVKLPPSVWCS